uniref:BOS complex subunit NCLN n=1 Tax=Arcella intermedia TaxID=1963864 RepID=A0A6B2L1F3_9EUKA
MCTLTLTLSLCLVWVGPVLGVYQLDVQRMMQYSRLDGEQTVELGSHRASLNSIAVTLDALPAETSLVRYVVMVNIEDITLQLLQNLIVERNADGVVIITPMDGSLSSEFYEKWQEIENSLIKMRLGGAVYFTQRNQNSQDLYYELSKQSSSAASLFLNVDTYRFEVSSGEGAPINEIKVHNIQGWLTGSSRTKANVPTIAIVASYDSFGLAPDLATGVDSNGSGVAALLELARLYSRLYSNPKTQGEYNLLFLLTGAGRFNYVGTKLWLEKAEALLLDSIDLVLCLDTIGGEDSVHFHVSRSEKDLKAKQVYDAFSFVAAELGIDFEIVHKKINISSDEVPWEHEQFARRKILSATISNVPKPLPLFGRSNIFDTSVSLSSLERNTKFIAEGLARYVYDLKTANISVFNDNLSLSRDYLSSWISAASSHPRMIPYMTQTPKTKDAKENVFITGLEKELSKHVSDVSRKVVVLSLEDREGVVFYDKTSTQLSAFRGKPVSFDILLSLLVLFYLVSLYTILNGPSHTLSQIKLLFSLKKRK